MDAAAAAAVVAVVVGNDDKIHHQWNYYVQIVVFVNYSSNDFFFLWRIEILYHTAHRMKEIKVFKMR